MVIGNVFLCACRQSNSRLALKLLNLSHFHCTVRREVAFFSLIDFMICLVPAYVSRAMRCTNCCTLVTQLWQCFEIPNGQTNGHLILCARSVCCRGGGDDASLFWLPGQCCHLLLSFSSFLRKGSRSAIRNLGTLSLSFRFAIQRLLCLHWIVDLCLAVISLNTQLHVSD